MHIIDCCVATDFTITHKLTITFQQSALLHYGIDVFASDHRFSVLGS